MEKEAGSKLGKKGEVTEPFGAISLEKDSRQQILHLEGLCS